jgi:hypothetical protein
MTRPPAESSFRRVSGSPEAFEARVGIAEMPLVVVSALTVEETRKPKSVTDTATLCAWNGDRVEEEACMEILLKDPES